MRRGGQSYYGIDVTNIDEPELMWKISGTEIIEPPEEDDGDSDDYDGDLIWWDARMIYLPKLGQSWSRPTRATVRLNNGQDNLDVLIFGGGYDAPSQDEATTRQEDTIGNAVYMVRVDNGKLVWMASNDGVTSGGLTDPRMKYSIPSDVTAFDANGDGLTDQFYVGDMGGQIWRFDIDNLGSTMSITGGVIGDLAGDTESTHRRFYHKPDVSLTVMDNKYKVAVAIGSGSRATPLNKNVEDAFFVLLNDAAFAAPSSYVALKPGDLSDRSTDLMSSADPDGWFIDFPNNGEKVLAKSLTLSNAVIFPTYTPPPPPGPGCYAFKTSKFWVMNLASGKQTKIFNDSNDPVTSRSKVVNSPGGLLPSPRLVITEMGPVVLSGTRQLFRAKNLGFPPNTWYPQSWEQPK